MASITGKFICSNLIETRRLAKKIASFLQPSHVLALKGSLGSGKTTFIKKLLLSYGFPKNEVQSPTYSYLHIYEHPCLPFPAFHFDLYRIASHKEFLAMGFEEYFYAQGICFIEWAEKIDPILPKDKTISIHLQHVEKTKRVVEISYA